MFISSLFDSLLHLAKYISQQTLQDVLYLMTLWIKSQLQIVIIDNYIKIIAHIMEKENQLWGGVTWRYILKL